MLEDGSNYTLRIYLQERVGCSYEFWSFGEIDGWRADFLPTLKGLKVNKSAEELLSILSEQELDKEVYCFNGCLHSLSNNFCSNYALLNGGGYSPGYRS